MAIDFADPADPMVNMVDYDFTRSNHTLCIVDTCSSHGDLTDDYAEITRDMGSVASHWGKQFLRDVSETDFWNELSSLRVRCGDRAVLRAMHFFEDDRRAVEEYGVEFRFTADDLRPHKKYFYAMREFPEACVITVDDDLVYSEDMIASLMKYHKKYPDAVCARRVHQMAFDEENHLKPYQEWEYEYRVEGEPSHMLFATGGGGTLYPPGCLPEDAFDIRNIKRFCQNADDIWLKVMELLAHKKVVWVKNKYVMPLEIAHSQGLALNTGNVLEGHNDMYLERLMEVWADILDTLGVDHKI